MHDDILIYAIWMFAGFINGVTSFGGNLVATPLMTLLKSPQDTVILSCICGFAINSLMTYIYRHDPPWKDLLVLIGASCFGAPAGLMLLGKVSPRIFLLLLAFILAFFLVWQLLPERFKKSGVSIPCWYGMPVGFVFGLLFVLTSMPGPVVAIYGILRRWNRKEMMFMMNAVGVIGAVIAALNYWMAGFIGRHELNIAFSTAPFCVAGVLLSIPVARRMSSETFRKGVLLMLAFSAGMLFFRAVLL